ncbi:MAG: hypothetical protein OEW90_02570 [Betaproteobacteria bacterium]|nr:hypothetical protein [Betaproteobacteria bacterium]MDH4323005.1 hypothetical protein [Betaproteobacteria bacterium]MDH5210136.1 hypothetical protein [Betaproteobacteria bacterium]
MAKKKAKKGGKKKKKKKSSKKKKKAVKKSSKKKAAGRKKKTAKKKKAKPVKPKASSAGTMTVAVSPASSAAISGARTALNPAAAWPFPTGTRP